MYNLGMQFKQIRKSRHITQAALSEASGVHYNTIINFENGKKQPTIETVSLLLDAMGYELCLRRKGDSQPCR